MMVEEKDRVLEDIVGRLAKKYRPVKVYLFGSMARGDAGSDSDYDIMILVSDACTLTLNEIAAAHNELWGVPAAVDVLVWKLGDFQKQLHLQASLPATIVREGKLVYSA